MESTERILGGPEGLLIKQELEGELSLFLWGVSRVQETQASSLWAGCMWMFSKVSCWYTTSRYLFPSGWVIICSWIWLTAVVSLPTSVPWVNLYSYHITKIFVPFSQTHSVDKAFLWCCCISLLTCFSSSLVMTHGKPSYQHGGDGCHQPGPWNGPVLLTDTFVCTPKRSPCDMVAIYTPQKKYSGAFIVCYVVVVTGCCLCFIGSNWWPVAEIIIQVLCSNP